jgi:hypothetical protein
MYKEANDGSENCRIPLRHALGVFQVGVAVCTSVVISGILANQSMPNLVNSFRTLGTKVIFEDGASPSDSLINFLDQADASRLPIAYQGNLAVLPKLPRQFGAKFDLAGSWLPEPLALLEEPIPPAVRQEVLQRWFDREHRDGYFLWDKINSIPGRASSWLDVIGQTHDCKIVSETSEWQLSHCRARGS